MATGLVAVAAARLAKAGHDLQGVAAGARDSIGRIDLLVLFDTLKYIARGGRIGSAKALMGAVLNVKPLLDIKGGEFVPVGQVRSRARGIERLVDLVKNAGHTIAEMAVIHSTTPDEARALAKRLAEFVTTDKIHISRLGPVLGVHGGPGVLAVTFRTEE
jgi:DegV family protein with EDD domain